MTELRSVSPQRPRDIVVSVREATADDVDKAAGKARAAQRDWAGTSPGTRAAALDAAAAALSQGADELTEVMVREVGKPRTEAAGEVARATAILRYYAQQSFDPVGEVYRPAAGNGLAYTQRRPRGVAGLITPWNFPLAIPLWKAAPALAFGNAVLLKPAPQAVGCAIRLAELISPHLPDGLFTVLPGDAGAGRALVETADLVSFTGSVGVGRSVAVAAAERGIPVQCEMGGHNPAIVLPDADVEAAAAQIAAAAYSFAGQKCTATKRVIVVGSASEFVDAFRAATAELTLGAPEDAATIVGPVIDEAARSRVLDAAAAARSEGGRLLAGGRAADRDGYFVVPTMVAGLPRDHELLHKEVFGPICALVETETVSEAIQVANEVAYGLVAAIYTADLGAALATTDQLAAGQLKVNAPTTGVDFHLPFGGERDSSYGSREQGKAAREFYTSLRTVRVTGAA